MLVCLILEKASSVWSLCYSNLPSSELVRGKTVQCNLELEVLMFESSSRGDLLCDLDQLPPQSCVSDCHLQLSRRFSFLWVIAWEFSIFLEITSFPSLMRPRPHTAAPPSGWYRHDLSQCWSRWVSRRILVLLRCRSLGWAVVCARQVAMGAPGAWDW